MFKRKLQAVGAADFALSDLQDDTQFRELILWIEQEKLGYMKDNPSANEKFTQTYDAAWLALFDEYLGSVSCPFTSADRPAALDWLLRRCVEKEHKTVDCTFRISHDLNRLMVLRGDSTKGTVIERGQPQEDLFATVDDSSEDFRSGVNLLAGMLAVPLHTDPKVTLAAVALLLQKVTDASVSRVATENTPEDAMISLDSVPLGVAVPEPELEPALRVIRLLHIANLRDLQTRFDEALVALQQITANPQTDTALGKTGRG